MSYTGLLLWLCFSYSLQRHNTENLKQIFPEKELRGYSPHSYFIFLWAIYIFPWSVCLFCCRKVRGLLTYTWMSKLGLRPRNSFSGNTVHNSKFLCSALCFWDRFAANSGTKYCKHWKHLVIYSHFCNPVRLKPCRILYRFRLFLYRTDLDHRPVQRLELTRWGL